ncbi:zf-HC2 domain-containing protein [Pseudomonas sp. 7P_10.2_Bac1]|uniref:anti-sigma factor family protein n=1 Tax=Pseudomonas sp. 7P_10.2_Bac1 TaxID=2971614 RepID=UPI0021C6C544|nr:zf-HC2 domain-containing protein [Pseudomonas sp. 7P_10.2_Bac1]MCU1725779.1 zf-HC2 domain-containing protein [Pseudomonas sp. 7P_10.2_Bac1]
MLSCKQFVARSSDHMDRQLSVRERFLVQHHLLFCPNCRRFIRQMRLMRATMQTLPESLPSDLEATVQRMLSEHSRHK